MRRGYFGIGIERTKIEANVGTLWRSAHIFGAAFIFTIGRRYRHQASDTTKAWRSIPLLHYGDFEEFYARLPIDAQLVGVELDESAVPIQRFNHPERAVYLLGAEDSGLSKQALDKAHQLVVLPGKFCLNVAVAGSIVMHDRCVQ
jgi:tRNA G18 (ribose-2'-O)-methylase SpoU